MTDGSGASEEGSAPGLSEKVDDLFRMTESAPASGSASGSASDSGSGAGSGQGSGAGSAVEPGRPGWAAGSGAGAGGAEGGVGGPEPVHARPSEAAAAGEVGHIDDVDEELAEWGYDLGRGRSEGEMRLGRDVATPGGAVGGGSASPPPDFGEVLRGVVRERVDLPPEPGAAAPPLGVSTDDLRRALAAFMAADPTDRPARAMRVRFQAEKLGAAGEHEGVALAVEQMLVSRPDDDGVGDLARHLVTDEVARVLTWRLVDRARDEEEGRALAQAFGRLNMEMADAVSFTLARTEDRVARRVLTEVLVRLAPEAQEIMAEFIQDARWTVVRDAVTVIGRTGIPNAVQFLTTALAHEEPRVRAEALRALAEVGGGEAAVLARSYLDVADSEVRNAAADAVGVLRDPGSVPRLLARLEDESDREGLVSLLHALGRIGDVAAFPALEKRAAPGRLGRGPSEVRVAAVRGLAALDTADGWAVVEALVDDRDEDVRGLVRFLLRSR